MTGGLTYRGFALSKTGVQVPVFSNGAPMYSLYNPQRDAEAFSAASGDKDSGFAVVFGLGNGLHIAALQKKKPGMKILAVEASRENLGFLLPHLDPAAKGAALCSLEDLYQAFLSAYIPLLHGNAAVLYQAAWKNAHPEVCAKGEAIIRRAIDAAKSDLATQAHFGRLWHRNILLNIQSMIGAGKGEVTAPKEKEACVVAAGPSLDDAAPLLAQNRAEKFILATDTAVPALTGRGIIPDGVVTIDGQAVSVNHFRGGGAGILFADLCCNPGIPRLFYRLGKPVIFTQNGHPLAALAAGFARAQGAPDSFLPVISSGAGTVTAGAVGIAKKSGFRKITLYGADFSFPGNKPYAKGTYLDALFFPEALRTNSAETLFASLMFRGKTVTLPEGKTRTTPLLLAYKASVEGILQSPWETSGTFSCRGDFLRGFIPWYKNQLKEHLEKADSFGDESPPETSGGKALLYSCLPLGAWESKKTALFEKKSNFFSLIKLAYNEISCYTLSE